MSAAITIEQDANGVTVRGISYEWQWSCLTGHITVRDSRGLQILSGAAQPAVLVVSADGDESRRGPGALHAVNVEDTTVRIVWEGVNTSARVEVAWIFEQERFVQADVLYSDPEPANISQLMYFPEWVAGVPIPGLKTEYVVQPGVAVSSSLSPVVPTILRLQMRSWLGRGGFDDQGTIFQQWGLPVHYFGGFTYTGRPEHKGAAIEGKSDSFCAGLLDLPVGDLHMRYQGDSISPTISLHGDVWSGFETRATGTRLGAPFLWSFGRDYRAAIESYYTGAVERGDVVVRERSERKSELLGRSQFNTWGAQMAERAHAVFLTQASLEQIYEDMLAEGMKPGIFVIDDKWEGEYGLLRHDSVRFPQFEAFLERVRADGMAIGMWAAFLRCDIPESHGLTVDDMLSDRNGDAIVMGNTDWGGVPYYLFDSSRPAVQQVLQERARAFMSTYRPDLIKFDFGYEIPSLATTAPHDRTWAGETFLKNTLEVIVTALREVNPDVIVMYYCLSPLFTEYVDQHSTDDMWPSLGEYEVELNRRVFFSSILGIIGVSSYGSGGYDWANIRDIWFDSAASGAIGSLGSFRGDQSNGRPTRQDMATFRGLSAISRPTRGAFSILPLGARTHPGSTTAHARSWIRSESDEVVFAALRTDGSGRETVEGLAETTADVAIASLTKTSLRACASIGLVPYGSGTVRLTREHEGAVRVVAHRFRADSIEITPSWEGPTLVIDLERSLDGHPVEWVECEFSD